MLFLLKFTQISVVRKDAGSRSKSYSRVLRGKGHWLLREAPEEFNAKVLAFLDAARDGRLVSELIVPVKL